MKKLIRSITAIAGFLLAGGVASVNAQFTAADVGSPALAGSTSPAGGGFTVSGAGSDIGGTNDQFHFNYQNYTGDFDVKVRVESFSNLDVWSKAGLMARENLTGGSRYGGAFATPGLSGTFFQSRSANAGATTNLGAFPATYPGSWLRLRRVGTTLTGYAGLDGAVWAQLGSVNIAGLAPSLFVGMGVSSKLTATAATAEFREFVDVLGAPPAGNPVLYREPLGPSTRRTGLTISEIMYHPVPSNNLEFIEIYNAMPVSENLSGWRISGDVDYTFPANTIIGPGKFLIVGRNPLALQIRYGIAGVLGPWAGVAASSPGDSTNGLSDSSGLIRLRNKSDAVLVEVNYAGQKPWPIAADGAGHSLVLSRPSYGQDDPRAWSASAKVGGSPGADDPYSADPLDAVMINEFLAHTDLPQVDYVELYNHGNTSVNLSGAYLSDDRDTNKFRIPDGTVIAARGFVSFDENQLGFSLSSGGERIYFLNASSNKVIDVVAFDAQANGVASGRFPDGAPTIHELSSNTPGVANAPLLLRDVVINEIMYNPISGDEDDEYVELFNRGSSTVDLSNWRINAGISYRFPIGTTLAAGRYLVVAKNATNIIARHPHLHTTNTLGNYNGSLANAGERVALAMPDYFLATNNNVVTTQANYVVVDEVTYDDAGQWGDWSDGGGSSLELIDPNSDNRQASNWADSNETQKAPWTTVENVAGGVDNGQGAYNEVHLMILGRGECLVDDIEVRAGTAGPNLVANPGFDSGFATWLPEGNHVASRLEPAGIGNPGNSMRLVASAGGDNGFNRVEADLTAAGPGAGTSTLRAKFRWLRGHPDVLLRVHGNWLEAPSRLPVPTNLGTPGLVNSRRVSNAGPSITDVAHSPVLPAANETIVVTARVQDADGLGTINLRYRLDPATAVTTVAMNDNGVAGDLVAGDGIFSGEIPGQPSARMIGFHVSASDANTNGVASSTFPANLVLPPALPTRECMVRVGELTQYGNFGIYRVWMSASNLNLWKTREQLSNEALDSTFVYNNYRVIYGGGARYRGSPFIRPGYNDPLVGNIAYVFTLPGDDQLLGSDEINMDSLEPTSGTGNTRDGTILREPTSFWMAGELGLSFSYQRFVHLHLNGVTSTSRGIPVYADTQQPDSDYIRSWFPDDSDGDIFKIDDWFEYNDVRQGNAREFNVDASLANFVTTNLTSGGPVKDQGRYRWSWEKKFNGGLNDDYSTLFSVVDAINAPSNQLVTSFTQVVDEESWITAFMLRHAVGDWDGYGYRRGKNQFFYKPQKDGAKMLLWDLDFSLGCTSGDGPTTGMFDSGQYNDPRVFTLISHPYFRRVALRAIQRMIDGPFKHDNVFPVIDERYNSFRNNGVVTTSPYVNSGAQATSVTNWIRQRRDNLIGLVPNVPFAISPASVTNANLITLQGSAPVLVKDIFVNGVRLAVTWTSITSWTARVVMGAGFNQFDLVGLGTDGNPVTVTQSVTGTYTGPIVPPEGAVVISEIMYRPTAADASYVEILNRSSQAFEIAGWRVNGVGYTFPRGSVIAPGQSLALAKNLAAFAAAYGTGASVSDRFDGVLDLDGETLSLVRPSGTNGVEVVVDQVRYENRLPWSLLANGTGPALQLVDSAQDNSRPSNWGDKQGWRRAVYTGNIGGVGTNNATPGTNFLFHLYAAGEVYIDDISLVAGSQADVGPNLLADPSFEGELTNSWAILGNHTNSVSSTAFSRSGNSSLLLKAPASGSDSSALRQFLPPFAALSNQCTVSFWYLPTATGPDVAARVRPGSTFNFRATVKPTLTTPGSANSVSDTLPAYDPVWLNELQAENIAGPLDNAGESDPWIELFNGGTNIVDLSGYYLADNYDTNLTQWQFPSGTTIAPGEFKLLWADGQPGQNAGASLHTSFRLNATTGTVALVRLVGGQPQVTDYLTYSGLNPGFSYGDFPDGQPFNRVNMREISPGTTNIARPVVIAINEWVAGNTNGLADPADNQFEDWFELYNPGTNSVDLGGFWLTDDPGNATSYFMVPTNGQYVIPAGGYLLVWADNEPTQNHEDRPDLHVDFQLGKAGDSIALYAPDKTTIVDRVDFGAQTDDIAEGRFPDGAPSISALTTPTPRAANQLEGGANTPPVLAPINDRTIRLGQTLSITASATDTDVPAQTLAFDLVGPAGAAVGAASGVVTWTPTEAQAPSTNVFTVRVTDSGVPAQNASRAFTVVVLLPPRSSIVRDGNGITIQFDAVPGRTYQIEYKQHLDASPWLPLGASVIAAGSSITALDDVNNAPQRFYRIVQQD